MKDEEYILLEDSATCSNTTQVSDIGSEKVSIFGESEINSKLKINKAEQLN